MKVKDWLKRNGLGLDDEIPSAIEGPEVLVSEELTEGLSKEDAAKVRMIAQDSGDLEKAKIYAGWLRSGDEALWNHGISPSEAIRVITSDFSNIRLYEGLVPVEPLEYFLYKNSPVSYAVVMRFAKKNKQ